MRNLFNLILKYYFSILFVLIELISLFLIFQTSDFHKSEFRNGIDAFNSALGKRVNIVQNYLRLRYINETLVAENEELRNMLSDSYLAPADTFKVLQDSVKNLKYRYQKAKVINNSFNKQFNFITINKGRIDGIKPEMAVISSEGVVGIVQGVSEHFSTIIPLINKDFRLSAKVMKNNYFGSLSWPGITYKKAELREIPYHVNIAIGDLIVTSGFSSIFPEGIPIGSISDYNVKEGNFYNIEVDIATDFKRLSYVYIIDNVVREEILDLENNFSND